MTPVDREQEQAMSGPLIRPPAARPCPSCPYRRDVPSGVWDGAEYDKLPAYDRPTAEQPFRVFLCHRADGRVCAGWAAVHGDEECIALRIASATGEATPATVQAVIDYTSPVPTFTTGAEAAAHGRADLDNPSPAAQRLAGKLLRQILRRGRG